MSNLDSGFIVVNENVEVTTLSGNIATIKKGVYPFGSGTQSANIVIDAQGPSIEFSIEQFNLFKLRQVMVKVP